MGRLRFGLDLDGVVYNWSDTYRFLMEYHRGIMLPEPTGWHDFDRYTSEEDRKWIWSEGVEKHGLFRYGHLYKGSAEALRELSGLADIVVITHRPSNAVQDTLEWLAFNRVPAVEVHLLVDNQPKWAIGCDIYLDDAPHNIEGYREHRPDSIALLWERPWNADYQKEAPTVVSSWPQVLALTSVVSIANEVGLPILVDEAFREATRTKEGEEA